jgi:hypothetical protein
MNVGIPPRSRNQRLPAACDAPTPIAASALSRPFLISRQNSRSTSRRSDGFPGDFISALPVNSVIHPAGLPIATLLDQALRPPIESAQFVSLAFGQAAGQAGIARSMGSRGDCFDNAVAESFFATLKKELIHRRSWADREELRREVFDYIEIFYNATRRHSTLGMLSPARYEERYSLEQLNKDNN